MFYKIEIKLVIIIIILVRVVLICVFFSCSTFVQVAFHALRFAAPIRALGDRLARRMWIEGPYIALHLRLEKDVWVRTGCLTGLGPEYDDVITKIRASQPEFLTGSLNMSYAQRRLAGLCPLNALEIARFINDEQYYTSWFCVLRQSFFELFCLFQIAGF